ncbi:MAG: DUF1570 domain-containing protein [Isosphaeraceae bacterium]
MGQPGRRPALRPDEQKVLDAIEAQARKVGLGGFEGHWTDHFLGVGNTTAGYRAEGLNLCEMIAHDFVSHFHERGFPVELPPRRMTVILLKDVNDYAVFSESKPEKLEGGRYYVDTNRLVVFDFRPEPGDVAVDAKRLNTFTLVHETIHLLSYNTGLLSAAADLPAAISEGIAIYGELWTRLERRKAFGMVSQPWLEAMNQAAANRLPWIPIGKLIADDRAIEDPDLVHLAYAESWLLVHMLLRQPAWRPKFRKYLAGMPKLGGKLDRTAYAESVLGPMERLDRAVREYESIVRRRRR